MTETPFTLPVPDDWSPATSAYAGALDRTRTVLRDPRTPERFARYYDRSSNFAGATFTQLGDEDPTRITDRDLLAVSLLEVTVPPAMVRSLLFDDAVRERISELLSVDRLPLDAHLQDATPQIVAAMDEFYLFLKSLIPIPEDRYGLDWVTAAKLAARKRPHLFPIRDVAVCRYLGLWPSHHQIDWQVFAALIADSEIRDDLTRIVERAAESDSVDVGDPTHLLRHLDVCLWTHAPGGA